MDAKNKYLKMKRFYLLLFTLIACMSSHSQSLIKLWDMTGVFKYPESVLYSPRHNYIFVSNMNGSDILAKDENGFISTISIEGKMINYQWVEGLNAPKGMGYFKGILYVADIDELVLIDVKKAKIVHKIKAEGAKFLNDVAVSKNGVIYISDTQNKRIYCFEKGQMRILIESDLLSGLNGLWLSNNTLYAGTKSIIEINLNTMDLNKIIDVYQNGGIDGIQLIEKHCFICSNWQGDISIVKDNSIIRLVDLSNDENKSGDILYVKKGNRVIVPSLTGNNVVCYSLNNSY